MGDTAPAVQPAPGNEHEVIRELRARFADLDLIYQPTKDDVPTLWVPRKRIVEILFHLRQMPRPYVMLYDLSAVDERHRTQRAGLPKADFTVFYHLLSIERNSDVRIKVALSADDLTVPSAIAVWPNANWYEREVWDLFGIHFDGHPHLVRIMMPRTWVGHPLRKDYPARATEFDPFMLDAAKQDLEQESLRFRPEEWGMKRHSEDADFMFLNLGAKPTPPRTAPSASCCSSTVRKSSTACPISATTTAAPRRWASARAGTAISPTPTASTTSVG